MRRFKKIRHLRRGASCAALAAAIWAADRPAQADLLGLYTFDDGTASDSSGSGNDGSVFGTPSPIPFGGSVDGLGYMAFSGDDSYIDTPINGNPNTVPQFTMGAWAKVPTGIVAGQRQIIAHDNGGWDRSLGTDTRGNNDGGGDTNYRWTGFTGNGPLGGTSPVAGTEDTWVFVAAVYDHDNSMTRIHVNDTMTTGPAVHGLSNAYLRIGDNPCCVENWLGDIDNVFFFDEALSPAQIDSIRTGGVAAIQALAVPPGVLINAWDFEGDLSGFSKVAGTAFDNQPTFGDNPFARGGGNTVPFGSAIKGNWFVGTYENRPSEADPVLNQSDAPTGIIESSSFVLGPGASFALRVGAGNHPWDPAWDPDSNPPPVNNTNGPTVVNLERMVGPDDWEVIFTETGRNDEVLHITRWDASAYEGDTVRLRVYDNHSGGWGHINVDDIRYYSTIPEPSTCVLAGIAGLGLAVACRRRKKDTTND